MVDLNKLKQELTNDQIISILKKLIPSLEYVVGDDFIVFPTVCHNLKVSDASMKLYYYDNTKLFFCYTHCESSFDIYELVQKILTLRQEPANFSRVLSIITEDADISLHERGGFGIDLRKYQKQENKMEKIPYSDKILNCFQGVRPAIWIKEGISLASLEKFNIYFSIGNNQAIIPHYDIDGDLVGIRVRNFDERQVQLGKYMPAKINGQWFAHPLSFNLYGIYHNKANLQERKTAYIFEGEKSVLLCDGWYPDSIAVATCGSKVSKPQIDLLLSLGVQSVVLCYDRMNKDRATDESYFNTLYNIANRYKNYLNFSFIYDYKRILPFKAAPVDCGKEVFETLLEKRIVVK